MGVRPPEASMPGSPLARAARRLRAAAAPPAGAPTDRDLLARYVAAADQDAFAELVRRHERQVRAVCRQVVPGEADVEDACQATFLALVRAVGRVRWDASLGGWLFAVAHRVAVRAAHARARAARRERAAARPQTADPCPEADPSWREAVAILHEELDALPDRFRLPLVLCYLGGRSRDEAAAELGWKPGSVKAGLERGRDRLRRRLVRRGVTLSAGLLSAVAGGDVPAASPDRVAATVRAAGGAAPAGVARLAAAAGGRAGARAALRLGPVVAIGLCVGFLAVGGDSPPAAAPPAGMPADRAAARPALPAPQPEGKPVPVRGVVLDPTGKPVPGAQLAIFDAQTTGPAPQPAAGPDGRFAFDLPPLKDGFHWRTVLASAPGFGADWVMVKADPVTTAVLRLVPDVPVTGRVVDLEGRPVAGAAVAVYELFDGPPGALDGFLAARKKPIAVQSAAAQRLDRLTSDCPHGRLGQLLRTTTAADGSFRLDGLGRDRVVTLLVTKTGIADTFAAVATRPGFDPAGEGSSAPPLYPPAFTLAVGPDKPITGVVRDAATKAPLAGVPVRGIAVPEGRLIGMYSFHGLPHAAAVTDPAGRYTLRGLAKAARYEIAAEPPVGAPHMHRFVGVDDTPGPVPVATDIDLMRGVVISGRVTDAATGAGVRAAVRYYPLRGNKEFAKFPGYDSRLGLNPWNNIEIPVTNAAGRYTLTAPPGPGVVGVETAYFADGATYLTTRAAAEDVTARRVSSADGYFLTAGRALVWPRHLNAYRIVEPKPGDTTATVDFTVRKGVSRPVRGVDSDGRPVAGVDAVGLLPDERSRPVTPAVMIATGLDPDRPRRVLLYHAGRKLSGTALVDGKTGDPVTIVLEPLGGITGRVVEADGT